MIKLYHPTSSNKRAESGQSLVELSLGLLFIFFFLLGLLDLGRLYFLYISLEDSAGEAAIYLSLFPECPDDTSGPTCTGFNNAEWRARNAAGGDIDWSGITYLPNVPSPYGTGDEVSVRLEYQFDLLTPIISQIANATNLKLVATATQTIVSE